MFCEICKTYSQDVYYLLSVSRCLRTRSFSFLTKLKINLSMIGLRRFSSLSQRNLAAALKAKGILLPSTSFSPKLPSDEERATLIEKSSQNLYKWQLERPNTSKTFVLHDGPPYANGDLHLGHALNKILKDIVNRYELIRHNAKVNYVPGWDCHGLPIEIKVCEKHGRLSIQETRAKCRELANYSIERQKLQFKDFAIMTDFDTRYVTMDHEYEVNQLKVFSKLFETGLLSRQLKPVWWGCETQTALAEAELEYNPTHQSTAIYVKFPLTESDLVQKLGGNVNLLIWTSTPWTIPANKAISINKDITYTAIRHKSSGEMVIVAETLVDAVISLDQSYEKTDICLQGSELEGLRYFNPSNQSDETFPVLHGDHVVSDAGTGLVHNAPAHGVEDHLVGKKHNLVVASVVDESGCYIEEHMPQGYKFLAGKYANGKSSIKKVLESLSSAHMLFNVNHKFIHSYPYDWRSKTPVLQRATPQWFINVERIKQVAVSLLDNAQFYPEAGKNRLSAFLKNRTEWCISRQRQWGVPLPIVYSKETRSPVEDIETIKHIVSKIEKFGTDEWFVEELDISRWLPEHMDGMKFYKDKDTMDVWFDSGVSWATLIDQNHSLKDTRPLADVYLEGSDQHRGWFQSSTLNRIIASGDETGFRAVTPFKKIITHGFTLDKHNDKMSKSKGNVILPLQVIKGGGKPLIPALGVDGLRLWVASSNYSLDVSVSPEVLKRVQENVKKLRITFKYLLGNLLDFEKPLNYELLSPLDKWVLHRLYRLESEVNSAYSSHNYAKVVREINSHMAGDLSALYFDTSKDCLYTDSQNSNRRRAVQTVLSQVLKTYIGLLGPIQPLLTQEVWEKYFECRENVTSPFMMPWSFFSVPQEYNNVEAETAMENIWKLREAVFKALERLRTEGFYKNKLELQIHFDGSQPIMQLLSAHKEYLSDYFLVSEVHLAASNSGEKLTIDFPEGSATATILISPRSKCPRCWKHLSDSPDILCHKCTEVCK